MTDMFRILQIEALRETGTLRFEIDGQLGEVRICYHGRGQLRVSEMSDPHGTATHDRKVASLRVDRVWHESEIEYGSAPEASSSNRSQPYSGAIIHTGRSSSVPEPPVTSRGFADRSSLHTAESEEESQEESEDARILERHLWEYRHILSELKTEQSITLNQNFANQCSSHFFFLQRST